MNFKAPQASQIVIRLHLLLPSSLFKCYPLKTKPRASLVVQWLRIHLLIQGTQVRALVWEDPTCYRATKPVHHNY